MWVRRRLVPITTPTGKKKSFGGLVMSLMKDRHLTKKRAEKLAGWLEYHGKGWSSPRRKGS